MTAFEGTARKVYVSTKCDMVRPTNQSIIKLTNHTISPAKRGSSQQVSTMHALEFH